MRKTKIICTIGPACDNKETLTALCQAGMNVARLNFSHGTLEEHLKRINLIKQVREELGLPIAIMLDTKGPEYRIGVFQNGPVTLQDGAEFTLTTDDVIGDESRVSVSYRQLTEELFQGDTVLINNGLVILTVQQISGHDILCRVTTGGTLSDRKSMNFPGKVLRQDFLSEQDRKDILFGLENDIDFVAASFVSTREDVQAIRDLLDQHDGKDVDLIAKIENRSGVDHIEEICEVADGIMVARGDLGVEIPFMEVPALQKYLISKCRMLGKRVITATEMLESMIHNPRPTRAEISDVANAVYDGSSAIMLSGETAAGKYPVQAVKTMAQTAEFTEAGIDYAERFRTMEFQIHNNLDAISHATCSMAVDVGAKAIVVNSISGRTARMVSRFRCPVNIIGTTTNSKAWRKLNMSWGVTPVLTEAYSSIDVMFWQDLRLAKELFNLQPNDNVVLTGGLINGTPGNTNTIKVETVK
ncbi:MAG: pyruvate kinase [Oscillospiraceae bacterium]|nr:pyruvate kinase [Oscillospiraceae bacterium]